MTPADNIRAIRDRVGTLTLIDSRRELLELCDVITHLAASHDAILRRVEALERPRECRHHEAVEVAVNDLLRRVGALERPNSSETPNSSTNTVAISAIRLRRDEKCICVDIDRGTGDWRNVERQILDDPRWLEATTYYAGLVAAEPVNVDGGPVEAMRQTPADASADAGKMVEERSIGQDIIDGLEDFNAKLESGEPIHGARVQRNQDGTVTQTPVVLQPEPATASEDRELAHNLLEIAVQHIGSGIRRDMLAKKIAQVRSAARQRIAELERQFADKDRDLALQIANATLLARERDAARAEAAAAKERNAESQKQLVLTQQANEYLEQRVTRMRKMLSEIEELTDCDAFDEAVDAVKKTVSDRDDARRQLASTDWSQMRLHFDATKTECVELRKKVKALETASNSQAAEWKERATRAEERLAALVRACGPLSYCRGWYNGKLQLDIMPDQYDAFCAALDAAGKGEA